MTSTELEAPRLALPPSGWSDRMARRYITALVRWHEQKCALGDPDWLVCNRLERLLHLPTSEPGE